MDLVNVLRVLLVCAALVFVCEAQLTFTPGWGFGKRSSSTGSVGAAGPGGLSVFDPTSSFAYGDCKTGASALAAINRMIQSEAQKFLECSQK
ncbi:hypertrehalosaemic prohormone [Uranotaenia lowii]|uniref:hypertrehalosaemic prohormone n=1 Tax=Uranotaenia lowii TaxID=190385 RepID=UPI0024798231|nr:hypertrehalosaemic prohormone [Uranotaenia lowii]